MDIDLDIDKAVQARYTDAAREPEAGLCCPVDYDPRYLDVIPKEVLERDYGCGDPVSIVHEGETVLDLGSGAGKMCFIAAQIVGPQGRVIGVDINDEMLALARRAQPAVVSRIAYDNIDFRKGRIEELDLDIDLLDAYLQDQPVRTYACLRELHNMVDRWRLERPLVPSQSIDVVISNCVLNLVRPEAKSRMFREIHRVLKPGGRAVISDIVTDRDVPDKLTRNPRLWSGCYSGALREDAFLHAFSEAGLSGIEFVKRETEHWEELDGVTFRSVTVTASRPIRPDDEPATVVYRGPFKRVQLDSGETLKSGCPVQVSASTAGILRSEPYRGSVLFSPFEHVGPALDSTHGDSGASAVKAQRAGTGRSFDDGNAVRKINIFENKGCQPSVSKPLAYYLRRHYESMAEINVYDLSRPEGLVPLPPSLFLRMDSGDMSCLPAMTVDSVVVTEGWLPPLSDALRVVEEGKPAPRPSGQQSPNCCGPNEGAGGSCCR